MKKNILLILTLLFTTSLIYGCAFEEQPVPDPIPYDPRGAIDVEKKETYNGTYRAYKYKVINTIDNSVLMDNGTVYDNILDIMSLQGSFQITYDVLNETLKYYYGIKYTGYDLTGEYKKEYNLKLPEHNVEKQYYILFNKPIEIEYNNKKYIIYSMEKVDGFTIQLNQEDTLEHINYQFRLCDPMKDGDCTSINGATKYIGYYRIEEITCNDKTYKGINKDFAGEITATAKVYYEMEMKTVRVDVPLILKFQVENDELKKCIFKENEVPFYFQPDTYNIKLDSLDLAKIFENVGLYSIESYDENYRTSHITYKPKVQDKEGNFIDKTFSNGKNISMILKYISGSGINEPTPVDLSNKEYYKSNQ